MNIAKFIKHMNKLTYRLYLGSSQFQNPHGLPCKGTRSTCENLGTLAYNCVKKGLFRQIVKTREYRAQILRNGNVEISLKWQNTNKLLANPNVFGNKTGYT